jgi:hypothetical protein
MNAKARKIERIVSAAENKESAPVVSLRESSIITLASHGLLDADQVAAAMRFRAAWESYANLHRSGRMLERIDGGRQITEPRGNEASRTLKRYRALLGAHGFDLLIRVCGEGHHIRDLYQTRRERDTATDVLRIHLSALAALEG